MRITHIEWDNDTIAHIARHGVDTREVEEVCFASSPYVMKTRSNRFIALGQTAGGRYLTIIFKHLGHSQAKIITARAMSDSEKRLYRRR